MFNFHLKTYPNTIKATNKQKDTSKLIILKINKFDAIFLLMSCSYVVEIGFDAKIKHQGSMAP